jgi:wyosine [tRNA(Phe)-imidazoG37] synthetase (radical SAM superfamily)
MLPLQESIVYGPVRSRRLGRSLGVNILPRNQKLCTFNCGYCEYGWTRNFPRGSVSGAEIWPEPSVIARSIGKALDLLRTQRQTVDRVTLSGHGEPTLHPRFADVVKAIRQVRDRKAPGTPVAILSNASTVGRASVRAGLEQLDERYMKLDAGDEGLLRRINAATVSFDEIIDGLRQLSSLSVQSMFVHDRMNRIDNSGDLSIAAWIAVLASLGPKAVQVYTIDRAPAWPYLQPVAAARLEEIARRARAAGLEAEAFTSQSPARAANAPRR